MKVSSERIVAGGFGLAVLLLASVGTLSYLNTQRLVSNKQWVAHTHEVLDTLDQVEDGIRIAESGRRGYIFSQEATHLDTYSTGVQMAHRGLGKLRQLTQDNRDQQLRIDQLEPLLNQRISSLQQSIDLLQTKQSQPTIQIQMTNQGAIAQQIVQKKLAEIEQAERLLLEQRSQASDASVQATLIMTNIGYLLSFGLLLTIYLLLRQEMQERQAAETALRKTNEQLETRVKESIEANLALQKEIADRIEAEEQVAQLAMTLSRSNQELEQFAYIASHDLQEPLRAVTSYTQMLSRRYQSHLDERADKYIHYIVDGAARMQQLINDLLTYSRVGRQQLDLNPTDCNSVLEQVVKNLKIAIAESNATVTQDPLPIVMADAAKLIQLLQNLISNALKYHSEAPPKIHISVVQREKDWCFSVKDNGIGIDPQYAERIFILFQRLHTRREYPGTGIGLAICKKIADLHQGEIWVESQPDQGSAFYFTLPKTN